MVKFRINPFTSSPDRAPPDYDRDGQYSTRFSETVTAEDVVEALDQIFEFTSQDCSASLSLNPSATREKGNTLASVLLTSTNSTGQNPVGTLTELIFKRGAGVLDTIVNPSGSESFNETTAVTDTTTFSATLTDSEARTNISSRTITFLYPVIHMVGAQSLTTAQIYSGATKILSSTTQRDLEFTTSNQVVYYCHPASATAITQILDINDFDVTSSFTVRTEDVTGLDGNPVSYKILEFQNLTSTTMTYKFRN